MTGAVMTGVVMTGVVMTGEGRAQETDSDS